MLQGTGSDVGKSLLVAGLCRAYIHRGLRVRPFKPQNMSNNAAVTVDGGEIGRAQALQARAGGVPASRDMNPVLLKPQIANFDDLDPLVAEHGVEVQFVEPRCALPGDADLVVLPGSKATIGDMRFLRSQGWDVDLRAHLRRGGWLLGLCGGYQMLGRMIRDPDGIEGKPGEEPGLGVLDLDTELIGAKQLAEVSGTERLTGQPVRGYEMHIGDTTGPALASPMLDLNGRSDGAVSSDGKVMGCSQAIRSGPPS